MTLSAAELNSTLNANARAPLERLADLRIADAPCEDVPCRRRRLLPTQRRPAPAFFMGTQEIVMLSSVFNYIQRELRSFFLGLHLREGKKKSYPTKAATALSRSWLSQSSLEIARQSGRPKQCVGTSPLADNAVVAAKHPSSCDTTV